MSEKWWEADVIVPQEAMGSTGVATAEGKWWEQDEAVRADVGPKALLSGIAGNKKRQEEQARLHEAHQSIATYGEPATVASQVVLDTTAVANRLLGFNERANQNVRDAATLDQALRERDAAQYRPEESPEGMSMSEQAGQYMPFLKQGVRGAGRSLGSAFLGAKGAGALGGVGRVATGAATGAARGVAARGAAGAAAGAAQGAGAAARGAMANAGGSAYGAIGFASAQEANRAITEGADAGLEGSALASYVASQGVIEAFPATLMQKLGLGGVESLVAGPAIRSGVKAGFIAAIKATGQEIPEELQTELLSAVSAEYGGVDKDALDGERLSSLVADTVLQTVLMSAGASAVQTVQGDAQARLARLQEVRAKGFVSLNDAKNLNIEGKNRRERLANTDKQIEELTQEIQTTQTPPEGDRFPTVGNLPEATEQSPADPATPPAATQPGATLEQSPPPDPATQASQDPAAESQGTTQTFQTASGSTYELHPDGTTTRNRAERGDGYPSGPQPRSAKTWFVDDNELEQIAGPQRSPGEITLRETTDANGEKRLSQYNVKTGQYEGGIKFSSEPKPGLVPVEYWDDQTTIHYGNQIVDPERDQAEDELAGLLGEETPSTAGPSEETGTMPTTVPPTASPDAPAKPETSKGETAGENQPSEARADEPKYKFGQVIPAAEADRVVSEIRAGDERSKNKGDGRGPEGVNEDLVVSTVPLKELESPDPDYGTYLKFLEATTDPKRVESYAKQKIDTPVFISQATDTGTLVVGDGGHRIVAAMKRGDKEVPALVPVAVHERLHPAVAADSKGTAAPPATATVDRDADIERAISNFKNIWGMEATATPVDKLSAEQQEALDFATSRGQKMAFIDIAKSDKKAPIGSYQRDEKVVLISNALKGDKLWGMIGHEMAHSKGLDEILPADSAELKQMMDEYFQSASPDVQKRLKTNKRDHMREGRARMVQKFFEDKAFRDRLMQNNPTLWDKLREAVLKFVGKWTPKDEAKRMLLDELRAAPKPKKSKGKKPEVATKPESTIATPLDPVKRIENLIEQGRATGREPNQALLDKLAEAKAAASREPADTTPPASRTVARTRERASAAAAEGITPYVTVLRSLSGGRRQYEGYNPTTGEKIATGNAIAGPGSVPYKLSNRKGRYQPVDTALYPIGEPDTFTTQWYESEAARYDKETDERIAKDKQQDVAETTQASADQVNVDSGAESKVKAEATEADFDAEMEKLMAGLTEPESGLSKPPASEKAKSPRKPRSAKKQPAPAKTAEEKSAEDRALAAAKKAAAKQAMLDAFKGTQGRPLSGFDPEIGMNVARATKLYIEAGALNFRAFIRELIADFGKAWVEDKAQYFESAWRTANKLKWIDSPTGKVADILSEETDVDATRDDDSESMGDDAPEPDSKPEKGGATDKGTGSDKQTDTGDRGDNEGTGSGSNEDSGGNRDGVSSPAGSLNNHQIAERPDWLEGGPVTKLNRNIDAITTMNRIEAEKRRATPDEQATIAKYTGWGHLKQFFIRDSDLRAIKAVQGDKWNLNAFKTLDARTEEQIRDRGKRKGDSEEKIEAKVQREKANNKHRINLATSMTPAEYAQARKSTRYSHYTDPAIARAMWGFIKDSLPEAGRVRVLEPSEGSGMFWGTMPESIFNRAEMHGIDMDPASSRVAKHLYPSVRHLNVPFQQSPYPEGFFDLAVTNVPFNKNPVQDPNADFDDELSLHNYFFAKTASRLREGGVVVFITTHFTMDAANAKQRSIISNQGLKFLGAVRLNADAFGNVANTKVTTDVIVMQKVNSASLVNTDNNGFNLPAVEKRVPFSGNSEGAASVSIHPYFIGKSDREFAGWFTSNGMIAGNVTANGEMRGPDPELTVESDMTPEETAAFVKQAFAKIEIDKQAFTEGQNNRKDMAEIKQGATTFVPEHLQHLGLGQLAVDGNTLVVRTSPETMSIVKTDFSPTLRARAEKWFAVRDALTNLQRLQTHPDNPESEIEAARKELNRVYDDFVGEFNEKKNDYSGYKPLNTVYNRSMFAADYMSAAVQALENTKLVPTGELDKDGKEKTRLKVEKASIFTERTEWPLEHRPKPKTVKEALAHSMFTNGGVDIDWIVNTLGKSRAEVTKQLETYAFEVPNDGGWEIKEVYLSGNIAKKLEIAEAAAAKNPAFTRNVDALREVLPVPKTFEQLVVHPNSPFMPVDLLRSFVSETLGLGSFDLYRNDQDLGGGWRANYDKHDDLNRTVQDTEQYAVIDGRKTRKRGFDLFLDMIAGKPTIIMDTDADGNTYPNDRLTNLAKSKRLDLSRAFDTFIRSSQDRMDAVTNEFNRLLSGYVKPAIPEWVVSFDGMSGNWKDLMRSYQKEAAAKIAMGGNTLLAHRVGYGKTLSGVAGIMEQRRLGAARKPLAVVPNHLTGQWAKAFADFYPSARVMAPTSDDFDKKHRQATMNRIMTGNWDAVIIPESSFKKLPMSSEYVENFFQQQISQAIDAAERARAEEGADPRTIAELEDVAERLRNQLAKYLAESQKDPGPFFDEMGIDSLTVDEAHHYKNLPFYTQNTRVAGINPTGSQQAFDMLMKTDFINALTGSRNVTFLTGTPIANSMTEAWVMMRYLMPETMKDANVFAFDDWKNAFGEVVDRTRVNTIGTGFRTETRFQQFVNLDVLAKMFQQVADIQMINNDVQVPPLKGGKPQSVVVPASDAMKNFMLGLAARSAMMPKDPSEDNMLNVMTVGAGAAIDFRLLDAAAMPSETSKITVAADKVAEIYELTTPFNGTQIIWADRGVPKAAKKLTAEMKQLGAWMLEEVQSRPLTMEDVKAKWKELRPTKNAGKELQRFMGMALQDMNYTTGNEEDEVSYRVDVEDEPSVWVNEITDVDPNITEQAAPPWNVYQQMKEELVARGIPAEKIVFIHDYKTAAQKVQLWEKMNNGDLRVLMGNTPRLGTGANIQQRLVAAHHLDAPWRPADVEQRDGRIIRSGNRVITIGDKIGYAEQTGVDLDGVIINRYVTEGSIDARYWDTNEMKAQMLQDFWSGNPGVSIEELGATTLSMSDVKAAAVANPLLKRKIELEHEVNKLTEEYRGAVQSKTQTETRLSNVRDEVPEAKQKLEAAKKRVAWWNESKASLPEGETFAVEIDGETLFRRDDIAKAIDKKLHEIGRNLPLKVVKNDGSDWAKQQGSESSETIEIGKVFGKPIKVIVEGGFRNPETGEVVGGNTWQEKQLAKELKDGKWERSYHEAMFRIGSIEGVARLGTNPQGFAARLRNFAEPTDTWVQDHERALASKEKALAELEKLFESIPEPDPTQLQKLQQELEQVSNEIGEEDDDQITYWVATEELERVLGEYTLSEQLGRVDSTETLLGYIIHPEYGKLSVFNRAGDTRPPAHAMVYVEGENATIGYQPRDDKGVMGLPILKPRKMLGKIQHPEHGELLVFNHKDGDVTQPGKVWVESDGGSPSYGYQDKDLNVVMGVEMQKYEAIDPWPADVKRQTSLWNTKRKKDTGAAEETTLTRMGQYVLPEMPGIVFDIDRQDFVRKYSDRALEPLWGWSSDPADADEIQEAIDTMAPSVSALMNEIYAGKFKDLSEVQDSEAYDKATVAASETDLDATIMVNLDNAIGQAIADKPKPRTKLGQLADKANKELSDAIDGLGNSVKGKLGMNLPLHPEVIAAAAKVVAKALKAGTLNFAELMERMVAKYGEKMAKRMEAALQQEWDRQVNAYPVADEDGTPPETPQPHPELVPPEAIPLTSVKNAIVDELRAQRGEDPMPEVTPQTVQQWLDAAGNRIASDPYAGNTLVEQLLSGEKTSVDEMEGMVLQYHYRAVNNLFEAADTKLTEAKENGDAAAIAIAQDDARVIMRRLAAIETALDKAGTAWGRAGVSRQIFLKQDFSLASMVRRARVANGGNELSDEQVAKISEQAKQIEELQKRIAELEAKTAEQEQQKAIDAAIKKDIEETKKPGEKPKSKVRLKAEERVASAWEKVGAVFKGKLYANPLDPELLKPAMELIKAYADLGMVTFREFMYTAAKNMGAKQAKAAEPTFRAAWDQLAADGEIAQPSLDMTNVGQLTRFARQIQRSLIENGVTEREEIVDAVHDALREILPEITRRQTMDALSSYGQFSQLSKDPIDQIIRDINGQLQQLAKLEDMEKGIAPAKTGVERRTQSDEERRLTQMVNEAKRRGGFVVTDPETQLKSALAAAKTAVRNRIADMTFELTPKPDGTYSRIVRNKTELIPDAELEQLRKDRDELQKVHKAMFPPKGATQAQKIASANRALDAAIASLEAKLAAGDISPAPQPKPLSTPELDAKRARLKGLNDQRNALRKLANPGMTAEQKKIRALDKSIEELEKQLATGNFAPKPKPTPLTSPEINARQAKLEELRATKKAILAAANPKMTPEQRASKAYEAYLRKQLAMYLEKIAQGDFDPKPKKPPRVLSQAELDLKKQLADVKHDFFEALSKYHLDNLSPMGRAIDIVRESAHLSRAIMTSFDLSAVLRQGGLGVYSHPVLARKAAAEMWHAIWSREKEFQSMEKLRARSNAQLYEESGLNITDSEGKLTKQEEAFMGRWARTGVDFAGKKVQAATKLALEPVAASARAYVTFINNLRADLFDAMVENLGQGGAVTKEEAKLIAKYINVATGRSDLKALNEAAATLNTVFFAPRYVASRFQYLAMPFYLLGTKDSGRVKRLIAMEYARTFTGAAVFIGSLAMLAYLAAGGDDEEEPTVEFNPLSADFGKVRIDETRVDPLAGLAQVIVFSSRMASFHTKSSTTGKIKPFYDGGPFETTHGSEAWRFLRTKLAPVPGAVVTAMSGMEDVVGNPVTPTGLVVNLFVPISVGEVISTMQHRGIPKGTAMAILNSLGAAVNTYGPKTAYIEGTPEERAKMVKDYIRYMNWESDLPAFSQYLPPEDLKQVQDRQDERRGDLVFEAMGELKPKGEYKSEAHYEEAKERHEKVQGEFAEFRKQFAPTYSDALRYLLRRYDDEGGVKVQGAKKLKPGFIERRARLATYYQES